MFVQVLYDEIYQRGRLAKSTQYYSCVSATYYTIKLKKKTKIYDK